mgnify:CR=1 FL=1
MRHLQSEARIDIQCRRFVFSSSFSRYKNNSICSLHPINSGSRCIFQYGNGFNFGRIDITVISSRKSSNNVLPPEPKRSPYSTIPATIGRSATKTAVSKRPRKKPEPKLCRPTWNLTTNPLICQRDKRWRRRKYMKPSWIVMYGLTSLSWRIYSGTYAVICEWN